MKGADARSASLKKACFYGLWILAWSALLWSVADRVRYASGYAASWDAVDFALALDRFDLLAMQPHFPGYPYFVLGGMAVRSFISNPAEALSVLNALTLATATYPVYRLARRYCSALPAFLATVILQTLPYLSVMGTQPMSEGVGVALVWWYVWLVVRANERLTRGSQLSAVAAFGVLCGVRVSFFPIGIGLLVLWLRDWLVHRKLARLMLYAGSFACAQLLWVSVLLLSEGSVMGFAELAQGFVFGHFNEWGGGVAASSMGWAERLYRLLAWNGLWTGLAGQSLMVCVAWGIAAVYVSLTVRFRAGDKQAAASRGTGIISLMALFYGLWAWLGQNIDKPRHIVPMVLLGMLLLLVTAVRRISHETIAAGLGVLLILVQTYTGAVIVRSQASEVPAVYQLAQALEREYEAGGKPFALYTWEETRVLQYLKVGFSHKRIYTYDYFQAEAAALAGQRILITGRVLEGFADQGIDMSGKVRRIAEYRSSPLFDPVYNRIELYEWIR